MWKGQRKNCLGKKRKQGLEDRPLVEMKNISQYFGGEVNLNHFPALALSCTATAWFRNLISSTEDVYDILRGRKRTVLV